MKFFIDTADLDEIRTAESWGVLSGVTTNPSLYAKTGGKLADFQDHMVKICEICAGLPVSAESQAKTTEDMIREGRELSALAPNIVVKLPICEESLPATHVLASEGVRINMTLVFSPTLLLVLVTFRLLLAVLTILLRMVSSSWPTLYRLSTTTIGLVKTSTIRLRLLLLPFVLPTTLPRQPFLVPTLLRCLLVP